MPNRNPFCRVPCSLPALHRTWHSVVAMLWLCLQFSNAQNKLPRVVYMNPSWLAQSKLEIQKGDEDALKRLEDLILEADEALEKGPYSVMNKTLSPPSGDKHDYMSLGPYWWPDPDKKDGLPYINQDGVINPESLDKSSDQPRKGRMSSSARRLALAYYFTGDEKYAKHAALLIRTWFLDPETRMNPNLNHGQGIRGVNDGRGIGIIETVSFVRIVDAVGLLKPSPHWSDDDEKAIKAWFAEYLEWMTTHPYGIDERGQHNNHGTYYDVQIVCFSLFTGNTAAAKRVLGEVGSKRISSHIMKDGSQPHELERTRSFQYSCYNLRGFFDLARMGERVGIDLWDFKVGGKPALRSALDFLVPFANPAKRWPYEEIKGVSPDLLVSLLSQAYIKYQDDRYLEALKFSDEAFHSMQALWYPVPDIRLNSPAD